MTRARHLAKVRSMKLTYSNVVASVALFFAVGGGAAFAVTEIGDQQSPTVRACVSKGAGTDQSFKYSDGTCPQGYTMFEWNKQGPKGAQGETGVAGPQGPKGQTGAQGPAGPSFVQAKYVKEKEVSGNWTQIAKIPLTTGYYEISAKGHGYMYTQVGDWWTRFECRLMVTEGNKATELDWTQIEVGDGYNQYASFALQGLYWTGNAASLTLQCKDNTNSDALHMLAWLRRLKLHARQIGGYTADGS
jgi:hypothetical protein